MTALKAIASGCLCLATALLGAPTRCHAGQYTNFTVAVYIPVNVVESFDNPQRLERDWNTIHRQLKVDKVYIEVQRDRRLLTDEQAERAKKFFLDQGVQVAGGMALSDGSIGGQFKSFCYTDPQDRAFIKKAAELAARHFDEVIQDDFFFVTTKDDSDIAAKGDKSWTQFRLGLMDEAAEDLLVKPAKAVNPKVKMVIKFPNWYEHFQGLGYDLDREPKIFDGIYTGTETRDPVITDQHLQQYESYEIVRYFDNIAPGRNGGGWVDTFSLHYIDRYAEQLWDTLFAKAPQIMLFEWSAMTRPFEVGDRSAWAGLPTSFNFSDMTNGVSSPTWARVAGYSLEQADKFLGRLGHPVGIASYKPYQSSGEDFLQDYLGMIGIPIEMYPYFPTNADMVLLTEEAKADPDIVANIKGQLRAGKSVVITSGLLRALQDRGIEDIAEIRWTDRKFLARQYAGGYGAGNFSSLDGKTNADVLFPEIDFLTNDSWSLVRAEANGNGFPLFLMNRYSKGVLYVWTMPDNFADLYALPPGVISAIKNFLMRGFPVRLDGPAQVALFAYDNGAFIVQNFSATTSDVTISTLGTATKLKNLLTGETLTGQLPQRGWLRRNEAIEDRMTFVTHLPPHSYAVFMPENAGGNAGDSGH
ncbi:MAG TPA: hypothetical protein VFY06_13810 [Verrucomicrobiae bacterium]|nr:hypothetical protein [Verrucomicrobiae bacterium]